MSRPDMRPPGEWPVGERLGEAVENVRRLRLAERYSEAKALAEYSLTGDLSPPVRQYLIGELAHLHYYFGEFRQGLQMLAVAGPAPPGVAAARLKLAESVNVLALNDGNRAYSAIVDALTMLRVVRAPVRELAAAQIQLVHVEANRGRPQEALRAATPVLRYARSPQLTNEERARAEYAVGFARMYAGRPDAIDHFFQAESYLRDHTLPLWQWIMFCAAAHLRDQGWPGEASLLLAETPAQVAHERAWFAVRAGDPTSAVTMVSRCSSDERPYARVVVAAARRILGCRPTPSLEAAAREFQRGGLDHWRWGALWILASASEDQASRRRAVLSLLDELGARKAVHWGFFDPTLTARLLADLPREESQSPTAQAVTVHVAACQPVRPARPAEAVSALRIFSVEGLTVLLEAALTTAEITTLVTAIEAWLTDSLTRRSLATTLALRESTVRDRLHAVRAKLGITSGRGGRALVGHFADRRLLTNSATSRALIRMSHADGSDATPV